MSPNQEDNLRHAGYFVVALAGFITGIIVGYLSAQTPGGSRVEWPNRTTLHASPRSLQP